MKAPLWPSKSTDLNSSDYHLRRAVKASGYEDIHHSLRQLNETTTNYIKSVPLSEYLLL